MCAGEVSASSADAKLFTEVLLSLYNMTNAGREEEDGELAGEYEVSSVHSQLYFKSFSEHA